MRISQIAEFDGAEQDESSPDTTAPAASPDVIEDADVADQTPIDEPADAGSIEWDEESVSGEESAQDAEGEEPAQDEDGEDPTEEGTASTGPQIDDVAWTIPAGNDRWDLDRDGQPDTVRPNPWQIIDASLPAADELGSEWDSDYRSTSIVSGTIVSKADTDCDEFDIITGVNNEYHGTQSWEREGESIRAFVVALDDSIQAAGIARMFGDLPRTCPTIEADPTRTPFDPFTPSPLLTAHPDLDGVLLEYPDGTTARIVARSHGALLHLVILVTWNSNEPSELAATAFDTIVDVMVESTPGAPLAVDPARNPLAPALPSGDDAGLEWGEIVTAERVDGASDTDSMCAARTAFAAAEDRFEVTTTTTFDTDVFAMVSVGDFGSQTRADETMTDLAALDTCDPPDGFETQIVDHDRSIMAGGHAVVPFTYSDEVLDGGTLDGAILTVGSKVAVIVVFALADLADPDTEQSDDLAVQQHLQLIVDHTVDGLEALS